MRFAFILSAFLGLIAYATGGWLFVGGSTFTNTQSVNMGSTASGSAGQIASSSNLQYEWTQPVSYSFWLNLNSTGGAPLMGAVNSSVCGGVSLDYSNWCTGKIDFNPQVTSCTQQFYKCGATTLSTGTWYHIVYTYDGSGTTAGTNIYLNGSTDNGTSSGSITSGTVFAGTRTFAIGRRSQGGADNLNALMNQIAVYTVQLTSTQVTQLYNSGTPGDLTQYSSYSNAVAYWPIGDGSSTSTTIYDKLMLNNLIAVTSSYSNYVYSNSIP